MKTIPNKVTTLEGAPNGKEQVPLLNYAALMKIVMNSQVSPTGFSTEDMRKNFRVLDAIDAATEESISLEDADFEHFKSKLNDFRWNMSRKDLIAFEDDINAIK